MAKKRVYELAKDLGMQNKELVDWLQAHGYEDIKSHSSSLDDDQAAAIAGKILGEKNPKPAPPPVSQGFVVRRRKIEEAPVAAAGPAPVSAPAQVAAEPQREREEFRGAVVIRRPPPPPEAAAGPGGEEAAVAEQAAPQPAEPAAAPAAATTGAAEVAAGPGLAAGGAGPVAPVAPPPLVPPQVVVVTAPDPRAQRPTATQAVVISRPLIPVRRVTPPSSTFRTAPMAPGQRAIGTVREFKVVPDSLGRGREFIDITKDKAGKAKRAKAGPAKELSKQELIDLASGRAHVPLARARKKRATKKGLKTLVTTPKESKRVIKVEAGISVSDLSQRMGVKANDLIRKLMKAGVTASINQMLDVDTAQLLATDHGYTVEKAGFEESEFISETEEKAEDLEPRPPVVTIMGHVDHGKTSLLDAIRKANVAEGEAGGITQHIGAYTVQTAKGPVTFLDTPGHEAFSAMRARGAQATDVAILVVAADDGVMPQTVESINHAKAAEVPIIVAINKIDKPGVNPEKVKQMLAEHKLVPEEWGGDTIMVPVSARTKQNLEQLLEYIALQAEVLELKANPNRPAIGVIVEAKLEKGRGPVATVLVQEGTLRPGDAVVTGTHSGKVRALMDERGKLIKEVKPGYCAEITGLSGAPSAGDEIHVVKDVKLAEEIAHNRDLKERAKDASKTSKISIEEIFAKVKKPEAKELKVILKADVQGSVEAVGAAIEKLSTAKVKVTILHKGVGAVTESDINLAKASNALVVGFHSKPESKVNELASRFGVTIRLFNIIYEAVDDVKLAMEGLLDVITKERSIGKAEVRSLFNVPKIGTIAGSSVLDGKISRSAFVRVLRDHKPIHQGKIGSLRRFKDDVKEVASGFECGIGIEGFNDLKAGDIIEAFEIDSTRQSL